MVGYERVLRAMVGGKECGVRIGDSHVSGRGQEG